jgi:peptidoglycan/LPS O-acetylase OafA/YrhL
MSVAAPASGRLHLAYIDGMRAVAAMVVVFNHTYAQAWCAFYNQFPSPELAFLTYSLAIGHLAVSVFIVISGFCLYLPVARAEGQLRGGALEFFRRRARRILPPYYAALALSLLLIATVIGDRTGTLWDVSADVRPSDILSHVLLLQNLFGTGRINYAFWSIALEWQIYFLFPLLALAVHRWGAWRTLLPALTAGYAVTITGMLLESRRLHTANFHYLGLFTMGMLAARIAFGRTEELSRLREAGPWKLLAAVGLGTSTVLVVFWGWRTAIERWPLLDLLVGAGTAGLLLTAARAPFGRVSRLFSLRPLAWLGAFSYSLYLIHAPLLQLIWKYTLRPFGLEGTAVYVVLLVAGLPLIVLASYLFYRVFEVPFMNAPSPKPATARAAA